MAARQPCQLTVGRATINARIIENFFFVEQIIHPEMSLAFSCNLPYEVSAFIQNTISVKAIIPIFNPRKEEESYLLFLNTRFSTNRIRSAPIAPVKMAPIHPSPRLMLNFPKSQ